MRNDPADPNPTDVWVGRRVRLRRIRMGLSQGRLADAIGLTFQQVQKYERGANRISASRLAEIARALNVPVGYFFEGLDLAPEPRGERALAAYQPIMEELLADPDGLKLAESFLAIRGKAIRRGLADLARVIAASETPVAKDGADPSGQERAE